MYDNSYHIAAKCCRVYEAFVGRDATILIRRISKIDVKIL
jgi:hypothetical protein